MNRFLKQRLSRRAFLRSFGRNVALGVLAALAVSLAARSRRRRPADQSCLDGGLCAGCAALNYCGLPAAIDARRAQGRPSDERRER